MNLRGHGIDLVENDRIASILERHRDRFLERVLTARERAHAERFKHPIPHLAGRFAAKEAVMKLLGTGWRGKVAWTDIDVRNDPAGMPEVVLSGECARIAAAKRIGSIFLSITHTDHYAAASAIGVDIGNDPAST